MPDGDIAVGGELFAPADVESFCSDHAEAIRLLGRRVVADIIEIGSRLIAVRETLPHGHWLPWLDREFGWTERTAQRFTSAAAAFGKYDTMSDLSIDAGAIYLLSAPSTPTVAREAAVERAEAGDRITKVEAERLIAEARAAERANLEDRMATLQVEITRLQTEDDEASRDLARRVAEELALLEEERDTARAALAEMRSRARAEMQRDRRSFRVLTAMRTLKAEAIAPEEISAPVEDLTFALEHARELQSWLGELIANLEERVPG